MTPAEEPRSGGSGQDRSYKIQPLCSWTDDTERERNGKDEQLEDDDEDHQDLWPTSSNEFIPFNRYQLFIIIKQFIQTLLV